MIFRRSFFIVLVGTTFLCTSALTVPCLAAKGGKGGGKPGGGDPPPIVNYQCTQIPVPGDYSSGTPWPRTINDQGEVVGHYYTDDPGGNQPYYYDLNSGVNYLTNLNDLSFNPDFGLPEGWYLYVATDINNRGDISGALAKTDDPQQLQGFVLELRPDEGGLPRLHTIPDDPWTHTYASRINDAGNVLGRGAATQSYTYQAPVHGAVGDSQVSVLPMEFDAFYGFLNNASPAQVLTGDAQLYSLGDSAATELGPMRTDNFNDLGMFVGAQSVATRGHKTAYQGYLYIDGQIEALPELEFAKGLNNSTDIVGRETSGDEILLHRDLGTIALQADTVVTFSSDVDRSRWNSVEKDLWLVSERGIAGIDPAVADFPYIVGTTFGGLADQDFFFLRPVPVSSAALTSAPEPSTIALLFLTTGAVALLRRH